MLHDPLTEELMSRAMTSQPPPGPPEDRARGWKDLIARMAMMKQQRPPMPMQPMPVAQAGMGMGSRMPGMDQELPNQTGQIDPRIIAQLRSR